MNELVQALVSFGKSLLPWVVVMPWEQGLRVRFGRYMKTMGPGVHFRMPMVDSATIRSSRREFIAVPLLDIMTADGKTLTVGITAAFRITDISALLNSVSQPEDAVTELVSSFVAKYIRQNTMADISQDKLEKAARDGLARNVEGIGEIRIAVTNFVSGRTYRLIMEAERGTQYGDVIETRED